MTEILRTPWTDEQVANLNAFQQSGRFHPFTCGGEHTPGPPVLVATTEGWVCPQPYGEPCDFRQGWAHAFMAEPLSTVPSRTAMPSPRAALEALHAASLKREFDSYVTAGFSEEQAMRLLTARWTGAAGGAR